MGDEASGPLRLAFNPELCVEFRGETVTSDAGLLLQRELDERLGLNGLKRGRSGFKSQIPANGPTGSLGRRSS